MKASTQAIAAVATWLTIARGASAQSNWAVSPDEHGAIYFCDIQRDKVWQWGPRGLRLLFDHNHCHTLVLGYDGRVYGENVGGESRAGRVVGIWRLTNEGQREFLLVPTESPDPSVWVVRDSKGNTYAWDGHPEMKGRSRILQRSSKGEVRVLAGDEWGFADGVASAARFGQVAAMAAAMDGTLYLVDEGNLRRVSADGTATTLQRGIFSTAAGGLPGVGGLYNHHMGVAVDADGTVYVVDYGQKHVVRWDAVHGGRVVFQSRGIANWLSGGGWGWRPTGVAVEKNSILVMEDWGLPTFAAELIGNPRVSRILADGKVTTVVAVANGMTRLLTAATLLVFVMVFVWYRKRLRA
jgi:hypothetical protein